LTKPRCILEYEAISYTWGEPNPAQVAFVVSGSEGERLPGAPLTIDIGSNLACALRYLRDPISPKRLWIDAICINQNNIAERNEQVLRMRDIYKYARRVLVWLGEEAQDSKLALDTIRLVSQQVEYSTDYTFLRYPDARNRDWFRQGHSLPFCDNQWGSIDQLLSRPWFERVWTMQEIAVGSHESIVQCGHDYLEWGSFRKAVRCLIAKRPSSNRETAARLDMISMSALIGSKTTTFQTFIRGASNRKATDPRDKIYGILGILPAQFASRIKPDYSLSVGDVYRSFALAYFEHFQRLDILVHRARVTPSWITDWFQNASIQSRILHLSASGISSSHVKIVSQSMLEVVGVFKATIRSIEPPLLHSIPQALNTIRKLPMWQDRKTDIYIDGTPFTDALTSAWCLNFLKESCENKSMNFPTLEDARRHLSFSQHDDSGPREDSIDHHIRRILLRAVGLSLFTTEEGYIGLCPPWANPGAACPSHI
jgi:hypothetical protein